MKKNLEDLDGALEDISKDFDKCKEIIENIESLVRKEEVTYEKHVERLQSLRFLYLKIVEWKELMYAEHKRASDEQAKVSPVENETDEEEDFDPMT